MGKAAEAFEAPGAGSDVPAPSKLVPPRGMKIVGIGAAFPAVVEMLGGSLPALCAESGLDPDVFADYRNLVPIDAFAQILHLGARQLNAPDFGPMVGARLELSSPGILGEAMRVCDTLGDALRVLDAHFQLNTRGLRLRFHEERDAGSLTFGLYDPLHQGAAQSVDIAIAAAVQVARKISGRPIAPLEIRLPRRAPADTEPHHALFRCPVRFNAAEGVAVFRSESLRRRLPGAQPAVRAVLERLMRQREASAPLHFEEELRRTLRPEMRWPS